MEDVLRRADRYRGQAGGRGGVPDGTELASADGGGGGCTSAGELAVGQGNGREVLANRRIEVYPGGQRDLQAGVIDAQVTGLLLALGEDHRIAVTSLKTGHSTYTASGNVSNHAGGRAVDIGAIDGKSCTDTSRAGPCGSLARQVARLEGRSLPSEVIFCFDPGAGSNSFARADHCDHLHVGFDERGAG